MTSTVIAVKMFSHFFPVFYSSIKSEKKLEEKELEEI